MIGLRRVLFLFGVFALASSKAFLPMASLPVAKASTGRLIEGDSHGPPFISNFIQEGTNVFFKPRFTITSHLEQPHAMIVENKDCNETPIMPISVLTPPVMEEPFKIVETVIPSNDFEPPHLKEVIEIKPWISDAVMSMPVAPAPGFVPEPAVISETPILIPMPLPEGPVPVNEVIMHEQSTLSMPIAPLPTPAIVEEPVMIPEAPVLPPLTMPELPVFTAIEETAPITLVPQLPVPLEPNAVMVQEPVIIPEAPILPPMKMPEIPAMVEAMPVSYIPTIIEEHVPIPETPVLPPLVMAEIPTPTLVEESESIVPAMEPVVIPEAPVLPPFTMPELPTPAMIKVVPELPVLTPTEPASVIVEEPAVIPEAPVLPPMTLPEPVVHEEKIPVKEDKIEKRPTLLPPALIFPQPIFSQQPCGYPFTIPCPLGPYANPVGIPPPYLPIADVPQAPMMPFKPPMPSLPSYLSYANPVGIPPPYLPEGVVPQAPIMPFIPPVPSLPSSLTFPTDCAQGIIAESIIPNMVGQAVLPAPAFMNPVPAPFDYTYYGHA